jgi:hypothetical protein
MLYPDPDISPGVPWNGLLSVTEKGDATPNTLYLDGQRYKNQQTSSVFSGTISAYTYPDEFEPYNGLFDGATAQTRSAFGFSYRTSSELHLVYNAKVSPSSDQYVTKGDSTTAVSFSWAFTTLPVKFPGGRPSAHIVILVDRAQPETIAALEDMLYGSDIYDASLPSPETVLALFEYYTVVEITDNGDGTWTADGPDSVITMLDANTFQIDWPSAVFIDATSYRIYSL